ncbi:MAG: hypothetical protein PHQ74_09760 [Crocinitomicaceae bacterium]|nr:hypothetical protein [Crocinitomicaceae bacterium]
MDFVKKDILFNLVFLFGILCCYYVYFQQDHFSSNTELRTDGNSSSNYIDMDTDIQDLEPVFHALEFSSLTEPTRVQGHFYFLVKLRELHLPVWLPPKLG